MRSLLALITLAAVALGAWKILSYVPPSDRIAAYEKATGTRKSYFDVGPNRVQVALIARNDRDGTLHAEDGQHQAAPKLPVPDAASIASAAPWLDVAEIQLAPGPEQIDIIEARVFDHETMEEITELDPAYNWRVVGRNVVQLYGLGKPLPQRLDLWFRMNSYAADAPVVKLDPTIGAQCAIGGASFTLQDIRNGHCLYNSRQGFLQPLYDENERLSLLLAFQGGDLRTKYQIAAISRSGESIYADVPHFLQPQSQQQTSPIFFEISLQDLDHFELRPVGGRHTFFFEAMELPKISTLAFAPPPKIKVPAGNEEIEKQITAFAPLQLKIATYRGHKFGGTATSPRQVTLIPSKSGQADEQHELTVAYWIRGIAPQLWKFRFLDAQTGKQLPGGVSNNFGGGPQGAGFINYHQPLERIGDIEVTLAGPPSTAPPNSPPAKPIAQKENDEER